MQWSGDGKEGTNEKQIVHNRRLIETVYLHYVTFVIYFLVGKIFLTIQ
jgi:hypothetical protein